MDAALLRARRNGWWFATRLVPLGLLFAVVYGLANAFAEGRAIAGIAMDWERGVPFVPWAIYAYFSIFLAFWLPLFVLEREPIGWLMRRYVVVTLLAGTIFLCFPTAVELERPLSDDAFGLLCVIDGPHNAAPSLHVAYAVLVLGTSAHALHGWARGAVLTWMLLVVSSTWLTHQHQLLDIVTGALLGALSSLGSGAGAGSRTGSMPSRHMRRYWLP